MKILRQKEFRDKVDSETAKEGKISSVIQKKPNGKWGIISYKKKPAEWWDADYETRENAEDALKAYHANH